MIYPTDNALNSHTMTDYVARYDEPDGRPVVILKSDTLGEAVFAASAMPDKNAYVLHVPTDLQRYVLGGRVVWLDAYGRQHPPPQP